MKDVKLLLGVILSLLCFLGCNRNDAESLICVDLNDPTVLVKGTVTDKFTQEPISGIEIEYLLPEPFIPLPAEMKRITDDKGDYRLPAIMGVVGGLFVVAKDIRGLYKPDTTYLLFNYYEPYANESFKKEGTRTFVATADFKLEKQDK